MNEELEDVPSATQVDSDDDGEFEAVDYRLISTNKGNSVDPAAILLKKDFSIPSRGEKDFEPDGTNKQDRSLQASRDAMYQAISVEREILGKSYVKATWHPESRLGLVEGSQARGTVFKAVGRTDREQNTWLMPEELLYLVERGNVECFYQNKDIPMSLQAAYAECLTDLEVPRFQVYAYLKRAGYMVLRTSTMKEVPERPFNTGQYLALTLSRITDRLRSIFWLTANSTGLLDRKTVYRSFSDIYRRLSLVPFDISTTEKNDSNKATEESEFKVSYDVWKPNSNFKKTAPGAPDFRVAVVDAQHQNLFHLSQINSLFSSVPPISSTTPSKSNKSRPVGRGQMARLKEGKRTVVMAVVDMGIISFMSLGDVSFGTEPIYEPAAPPGPKPKRDQKRGGHNGPKK